MGPGDEIIVPGDLECSCNMVSSIWSVERKTYRSMCTFEVTVIVTVKVTVKVKDLGEEERMMPRMLLKDGERENWCSLGEYFLNYSSHILFKWPYLSPQMSYKLNFFLNLSYQYFIGTVP